MSLLEIAGNIFTVLSVYLAAKNNKLTWPIGIIGCILYGYMFYTTKLYADVTLQIFFIITSIIGFWTWMHNHSKKGELPISSVTLKSLFLLYFPVAGLSALLYGYILQAFTDASLPFIDSVVLTFSVIAQFLLMKRKIESWIFWIIVNAVSAPLYAVKGLYMTSGVYAVFLLNAFYGLWKWKREMHRVNEKV